MGEESIEGRINKMLDGVMELADEGNTMMEVDLKRSLTYGAETTGAKGLPVYSIGGGTEGRILSAGCGTTYEMASGIMKAAEVGG